MYYKCIGVRRKLQAISCTQFQAYLAKDNFCVLFNKRERVFYRVLNHEANPEWFQTRWYTTCEFIERLQNIAQKAFPSLVRTKVQLVRGEH